MNIKPLADRVLVLPAPAEEKVGGIIIPDTAKEKPQRGKVVATGKGTKDEEMILKEGDTVLYGKYAGTELEFDGTKYIMMRKLYGHNVVIERPVYIRPDIFPRLCRLCL